MINLEYKEFDPNRLVDDGVRQAFIPLSRAMRATTQTLKRIVDGSTPERGEIRLVVPIAPRQLTVDPRTKATFGRRGEIALLEESGELYYKHTKTATDYEWGLLASAASTGGGGGGGGGFDLSTPGDIPDLVDLVDSSVGIKPRAARADHHHKLDTTIDPFGDDDSWTGIHEWRPDSDFVPVTITKTAALLTEDLLLVRDLDLSALFKVNNIGLTGINTEDPDAMLVVQGQAGLTPPAADPLAWYLIESLTTGGEPANGTAVTTWEDSTGNGHDLTGAVTGGGTIPAYYQAGHAKATPDMAAVSFESQFPPGTNNGYFTLANAITLDPSNDGWTIAFICNDWHSVGVDDPSPLYLLGSSTLVPSIHRIVVNASADDAVGETDGTGSTRSYNVNGTWDADGDNYCVLRCAQAGGASPGHLLRAWLNGVLIAAGPSLYDSNNTTVHDRIGTTFNGAALLASKNLSICEIIIWNRELTDDEVDDVNAYLAGRLAGTEDPVGDAFDLTRWKDAAGVILSRVDEQGWYGHGVDPTAPLHIRSTTTPQFRLEYDATHHVIQSVAATGAVTIAPTTDDAAGVIQYLIQPTTSVSPAAFDSRAIFRINDETATAAMVIWPDRRVEFCAASAANVANVPYMLSINASSIDVAGGMLFNPGSSVNNGTSIGSWGSAAITGALYFVQSGSQLIGGTALHNVVGGAMFISSNAGGRPVDTDFYGIGVQAHRAGGSGNAARSWNAYGWKVFPPSLPIVAGPIDQGTMQNVYGGYIQMPTGGTAARTINVYGLFVEASTTGSTTRTGIHLQKGSGIYRQIVLGSLNDYINSGATGFVTISSASEVNFRLNSTVSLTLTDSAMTFSDIVPMNIVFGTSNGNMIGTAPDQRFAFLGATPLPRQPSTVGLDTLLAEVTGFGLREEGDTTFFDKPISAPGLTADTIAAANLVTVDDMLALESKMNEMLDELRSVRLAVVKLATDDGRAKAKDFDPPKKGER